MNVDELADRGPLMLMHVHVGFLCLYLCTRTHISAFNADYERARSFPPLCDCVSVCSKVKVGNVGENNSGQASDGS